MALEKKSAITKIEIVGPYKHVQVRTSTWIEEDGVKVGGDSHHRHVVAPDADITNESQEVQDICNSVHTDEVKAAYAAHIADQEV
jgi:hypothetical protein